MIGEWDIINDTGRGDSTERMRVPGGWLYRTIIQPQEDDQSAAVAMVFVPFTVEEFREQSKS